MRVNLIKELNDIDVSSGNNKWNVPVTEDGNGTDNRHLHILKQIYTYGT